MQQLLKTWEAAGLAEIKMQTFTVTRTFADFDEYWSTAATSPRIATALQRIPPEPLAQLREHVRASVHYGEQGTVVPKASANAVVARA